MLIIMIIISITIVAYHVIIVIVIVIEVPDADLGGTWLRLGRLKNTLIVYITLPNNH